MVEVSSRPTISSPLFLSGFLRLFVYKLRGGYGTGDLRTVIYEYNFFECYIKFNKKNPLKYSYIKHNPAQPSVTEYTSQDSGCSVVMVCRRSGQLAATLDISSAMMKEK